MNKTSKEKVYKLTLVKSLAGRSKKHQSTVRCLGLRRMHQTVEVRDNPVSRGMIDKVAYLLRIEES